MVNMVESRSCMPKGEVGVVVQCQVRAARKCGDVTLFTTFRSFLLHAVDRASAVA